MPTLRNSPAEQTILRLEARKSFRLILWIKDSLGSALDITGVSLRMVVRKDFTDTNDADAGNLIASSDAILVAPGQGYASFDLQASELDHPVGEYQFVIAMIANGYSAAIISGLISIEPNTEFGSMSSAYTVGAGSSQLVVTLQEQVAISVYAGQALAPGTTSFMITDKTKLDSIEAGAQVNIKADWNAGIGDPAQILNRPVDFGVAAGGAPGEFLMKSSILDLDTQWSQPPTTPAGNLDATGVVVNKVPVTTGINTWAWATPPQAVVSVNTKIGTILLDLTDIPDSVTRLAMTTVERSKLTYLSAIPAYSDLVGRPTLGTAAAAATTDFLPAAGIDAAKVITGVLANARVPRVNDLRGTSRGTAAPTGGVDGDTYRQYT